MVHRADVLKDRTWALNGRTFRQLDKAKYEMGGFRHVWESIRPHFEEVQATMQGVTILAGSSQSLISDSGDSEFYHQRQHKEAISAEIKACPRSLLRRPRQRGSPGPVGGFGSHLGCEIKRGRRPASAGTTGTRPPNSTRLRKTPQQKTR